MIRAHIIGLHNFNYVNLTYTQYDIKGYFYFVIKFWDEQIISLIIFMKG
jgi:hypothetical protein